MEPAQRRLMWKFGRVLLRECDPHRWHLAKLLGPPDQVRALHRIGFVRQMGNNECTLTKVGLDWVMKHTHYSRAGLEAQYLVFDVFREQFDKQPTADILIDFADEEDEDEELGLTFDEIVGALEALRAVEVLELVGMNQGRSNSYRLTRKGKRCCSRLNLLEAEIEGTQSGVDSAAVAGPTYNVTVNQGQAFVANTGRVVVDQGDLNFGNAVPQESRDELVQLLTQLREHLTSVGDPEEKDEAAQALTRVEGQLAKPKPDPERLKSYLGLYEAIVTAAAPTLKALKEMLQALGVVQ